MFDSYGRSDSLGVNSKGGTGGGRGQGRPLLCRDCREREERHPRRVGDRDTAETSDLQAGKREHRLQVRATRDEMALGTRSVARLDQDQRLPTIQGTPLSAFLNSMGHRYRPQESRDSPVATKKLL